MPLASIRNPLNKIRQYFSTIELTRGFFIAFLGSIFLYMEYWSTTNTLIITISGLLYLYFLLNASQKVWLISGFFTGIFWFWWIALSFEHYQMPWAIPIVVVCMGLLYAFLFWIIAYTAEKTCKVQFIAPLVATRCNELHPTALIIKAFGLLLFSYIHPFGFDWFKPELMFVNSYIGIEKWQFAIVLAATVLSLWKRQLLYLFLTLLAYQPSTVSNPMLPQNIELVNLHTPVKEKWDAQYHKVQFQEIFSKIDRAIKAKKTLIIFPESVFPIFLNYDKQYIRRLKERSKHISIVVGALHWDGETPHNSSYIFTENNMSIANKVLLVPFGESNPLPDFLSDWVNAVFYDGAVDYKASENVVDYTIDGVTYRNAICFEATSEKLYEKDKDGHRPENMIVLSNNGWFTPSIEPVLQRLQLQYYSKKYGTTIYHSVNMSPSYIIQKGHIGTAF